MSKTVRILGTHGVPANYGGFETAAQNVALYLRRQGWNVIVYTQTKGNGPVSSDTWQDLVRVKIPISLDGWRGTVKFDLLSIRHAARSKDPCLTFGYNTAIFNVVQLARRIPNIINMDGMEWTRARWGLPRQAILFTNERIAAVIGTHLIADHPVIEQYLRKQTRDSKVSMIPYGADLVDAPPADPLRAHGLEPGRYLTLICRPIPENSILEIIRGFSCKRRNLKLAVLGDYSPDTDPYHRSVLDSASDEVTFLGSIYDDTTLKALRFHSRLYLHGHTVGGTNPSLVEAMAAGNAIIAHDNAYNRWVAADGAVYFSTASALAAQLDALLTDDSAVTTMSKANTHRHAALFTWDRVAAQYEDLLLKYAR